MLAASLTFLVGHLVFSSVASFTAAFVPVVTIRCPPSNYELTVELSTGMLPRHGQMQVELCRPRPNSRFPSLDITASTKTISREETRKFEFLSFLADNSNLQDLVAVLLFTFVSYQVLFISLCGEMKVGTCVYVRRFFVHI
jgi:hypothetical protein